MLRGCDYDRWDLTVKGGMLGAMRILMAIEEHGLGQQMVRFRVWPRYSSGGLVLMVLLGVLAAGAALDGAWAAFALLGFVTAALALRALQECGAAAAAVLRALRPKVAASIATLRPLEPSDAEGA